MEQSPLLDWHWLTKQLKWVQLSSQQDMFSINTFPLLFSCIYCNNGFILTMEIGFVQYIHVDESLVSLFFGGLGSLSCLPLGQESISLPRPVCLQGLRPAFIPCSTAKVDTPPGHEERGMYSNPPPSSFSPEEQGWRPLYGKQPRPQASYHSVFHPCLYLLTLCSFFLAFVQGLYAVVEYTMRCSRSVPQGHGELGRGPR